MEKHINPDGSVVEVNIGEGVRIGEGVNIGRWVSIKSPNHILEISPIGSEGGILTVVFSGGETWCGRGCFWGTLKEFTLRVKEKGENDPSKGEYLAMIEAITTIASIRMKNGN